MHPILARPARLAAYTAVWIPLGGLLGALLALQGLLPWTAAMAVALPLSIVYGFLCLSAWYAARGLPMETTGLLRIIVTAAIAAAVSSAIWVIFANGWMALLAIVERAPAIRDAFRSAAPTLFAFGVLLYLLALSASYVLAAFEASREAERRGLEMQVLAREAELRALRAQIDPHFLFNSLQSISALTTANPAGARRMCLLLADFLRDTLSLGTKEWIGVERELALAERFLAVEQVRYGDRLRVEVTTDEVSGGLVPPLVLQPLVENAVTHGIAHVLDGGVIRIVAKRRGDVLKLVVENPCDPDRPAGRGTGLGLRNVRERLHTLFGHDAEVRTEESGGVHRTWVELPWRSDGE